MESSSGEGLIVTYDDETSTITFDWDPETHPQWNYLQDLTSEEFTEILLRQCEETVSKNEESADGQES